MIYEFGWYRSKGLTAEMLKVDQDTRSQRDLSKGKGSHGMDFSAGK